MTIQQTIKQVIIDLAVQDKLPMDLTELNPDIFTHITQPIIEELKSIRMDATMALDDDWDRSDDGFKAQINDIDEILDKYDESVFDPIPLEYAEKDLLREYVDYVDDKVNMDEIPFDFKQWQIANSEIAEALSQ